MAINGDKCSYFHCNKTRKNDKDVRFHTFPKDVTNSRIWLLNSGNSKLFSLRHDQLRKRFLCSDHFIDSMYMNADKDRLIQKAVPIKYPTQLIEQLNEPRFIEIYTPVTTSHPKGDILNDKVEDNELNSTSLESLKVLTPRKNYNREPINILNHKKAASSMFSSTFTVTPDTQNYISDLPELPSSSIYSSTLTDSADMQNYIPDLPELPTSSKFSSTHTITPDMQDYNSDSSDLPSSLESIHFTSVNYAALSLELKNEHLEDRCNELEKLINKKTVTISNLKNRYLKLLNNKKVQLNSKLFIDSLNFESINSKSLVSMQINCKSRKALNNDEKKLSLALYLKSPSMYRYLRHNKIALPGENVVRSWINPGCEKSLKLPVFATFC